MLTAILATFSVTGCNWASKESNSAIEAGDAEKLRELSPEELTGTPAEIAEKLLDNWSQEEVPLRLRRVVSTRPLSAYVREATFSGDGKRVVARLRDSTVIVIDAKSGKTLWTKKIDLEDLSAGKLVTISRDGRFVAISLYGRKVEVWDVNNNQLVVERAERNPVHFVGLNHTGDSFFICEAPPPPGNTGDPNYEPQTEIEVAGPVEISFADGEATSIEADGFEQGVVAMAPIMGGKGYLVLDAYSQLRYWNPERPNTSKQLAKRTVFAKVGESWVCANQHVFMAQVEGSVMVGSMATLGLDPEPAVSSSDPAADENSEIDNPTDDEGPSLPTLVDLGQRLGDKSGASGGNIDATTGRCFTVEGFSSCDPDFPSLVVYASRDENFRRALDLSADCKFVVAADKDYSKTTLTIYELGKIPDHPAMRIHKWARKALAEENYELIDAVIAAAEKRDTKPKWAYTLSDSRNRRTPLMQQVVQGALENRWGSQRVVTDADAVKKWKEKRGVVTFVDPKALVEEAIDLSRQNVDYQDNAPAKQLVDFVLNDPKADAEAIVAFIEMCPQVPTGRKVLIDVAARAAELCDPNHEVLVEIANGLMEYSFEQPDAPIIEATLGLIEGVANAEARKKGAAAGDLAYATLAVKVTNASYMKFVTGRERVKLNRGDALFSHQDFQRERLRLARYYLDYERLVRGLTTHLTAKPNDRHAATLALELGYESDDKDLAKLGIACFENNPGLLQPPPYGQGNIKPYLDWAKSP